MLFILMLLLLLACGVGGLVLLASRVRDRAQGRRAGAGLRVVVGLAIVGAAVVLPWTPALGENTTAICLQRDTPTELVGIISPEAIGVDAERAFWPWGYRCTFSHYAYGGTITDQPGWGYTMLAGVGVLIAVLGATALVGGRRDTTAPTRT